MKQITLSPRHYAAGWKTEGVIKPIPEVTDLGRRYAELPLASPEKEALLLELCQCFHPYLMKYLVMICLGHVPVRGRGAPINQDIKPFLLYFLPKGQTLDWPNMVRIVKGFHLAFKGIETDEIYDILMEQMVSTIKGYDPAYTEKVKRLVEVIQNELSTRKQFSFADVNRHLDFDCNRYIRLLGRRGFLCPAPQRPAGSIKKFIAPPRRPGTPRNRWLRPSTVRIASPTNSPPCKNPTQAVRPQLDSFRKVTQPPLSPTAGSTGMTSFR
jgi:hypothetical protein